MDSQTHIELALKLVSLVGGAPETAVCSLFPQIDRDPPTLHRLYAHTVFKARPITDIGLRYMFGDTINVLEMNTFTYRRFAQESPRFRKYIQRFSPLSKRTVSHEDLRSGKVAFVSHLYLDTFNQPTQAFAPLSVYCSGQWELWKRLGDFRLKLYTTEAIHKLRKTLFEDGIWTSAPSFRPEALIEAMMVRIYSHGLGAVPASVVDQGMFSIGMAKSLSRDLDAAVEFLTAFETLLSNLHETYLPGPLPTEKVLSSSLADNER